MLRSMIGRALSIFILLVIVVAVWRANNGDMTQVANGVWDLLSKGADLVVMLWNGITHAVANSPAPTPTP